MESSSISFTAHYTGHVWYEYGLSRQFFTSPTGHFLYHCLQPIEFVTRLTAGFSIKDALLQRHHLISHCLERLIEEENVEQVLEIGCGLSPRGYSFSRKYPHLHYIEADLPDMAKRKKELLTRRNAFGPNHKVITCDFFKSGALNGLDHVFNESLDTTKKTVILTEGLISYFDLPTISDTWEKLSELAGVFPEAWYITDIYARSDNKARNLIVKTGSALLGLITKSKVTIHFDNETEIIGEFNRNGFSGVTVHDPSNFYSQLPIPRSNVDEFVKVLVAKV